MKFNLQLTRDTINWYFTSLVDIVQKRKISNRIRFLIEDVVDLRKSQWKPRHDDNAPKTINQFHRDVHKDQERQFINPQFQRNMGDMSRDGRMGDRWDRDDRNRKQSRMLTHFIVHSRFFFSGAMRIKFLTYLSLMIYKLYRADTLINFKSFFEIC